MHYSETAFVLPAKSPEAAASVRIFTSSKEIPFAGHPTIGTAFLLASLGRARLSTPENSLTLELGTGLVKVFVEVNDRNRGKAVMEQEVPQSRGICTDLKTIAASLCLGADEIASLEPEVFTNGVSFLIVCMKSLASIKKISPNALLLEELLRGLKVDGLVCFTTETIESSSHVHVRAFFPELGVNEDAATGAAQGPLAAYLFKNGLIRSERNFRLVSEQGYEIGRPSRLTTTFDIRNGTIDAIKVSGDVLLMARGEFLLK
ncbi:MAG: PhzF family phenazine biosynthesis protein, partial [Blastocatellia bacterium]|nr:PhzF family phenazine biosynthesis protein [Blastocatellia bacterium]